MSDKPTIPYHWLADLQPMMRDAEFASFKASIATDGQTDAGKTFEGKLIDGRNRERACRELGIAFLHEPFEGTFEQAFGYVCAKGHHRHLSDSQKACVAANFLDVFEAERKKGRFADVDGKSRDHASLVYGVSPRYVQDARLVKRDATNDFNDVFNGRVVLPVAVRALQRRAKAKQQAKQAKAHKQSVGNDEGSWEVIIGDGVKEMAELRPAKSARLVFIDPPYNIGIDYGSGAKADRRDPRAFATWLYELFQAAHRVLTDDGSIFVLVSSAMSDPVGLALQSIFGHRRATIVWQETFGTYQAGNFSDCWRAIHYYTKHKTDFVWHGDQIHVPSDRQAKYGDKRANPTGKVPGNVWTEFPRLVDNAAERVPGFPTQIPWKLIERIIRVASDPGDLIIDPCNGSGTTGEAAVRNNRRYLGVEIEPTNADLARARLTNVAAELHMETP